MNSLGMILRRAREAQGRSVADVAEELCITRAYVRAMEADDLASLPSPFFYKAFVKQYAEWLDIPEREWQAALLVSMPAPAAAPEPVVEEPVARQHSVFRVPDPILEAANKLDLSGRRVGTSVAALVLVVVGCTSFYGWWMERPTGPAAEEPAVVSQASTVQTVADKEEEMPSLDVTTLTDADGVRRVVLNLSAKETTWLSITSDGKPVFSGTLSPSETKTLSAPEVARLKVGNAGGLDIRWNGKPIGPIGESGQVRVVLFTPEEFRIITPEPKPVEDPAESL